MIYYDRSGMLGRFLERPFSRFLGRISFSFYLYNPLLLAVLSIYSVGWSFSKTNPIELGLLVSVPIIAATIPLAYLSTRFIEEPCNIWAHRMLKPPVRTPQTAL
jgi:peptidoglycan/LPS O-acetylase OafA/YrhL